MTVLIKSMLTAAIVYMVLAGLAGDAQALGAMIGLVYFSLRIGMIVASVQSELMSRDIAELRAAIQSLKGGDSTLPARPEPADFAILAAPAVGSAVCALVLLANLAAAPLPRFA